MQEAALDWIGLEAFNEFPEREVPTMMLKVRYLQLDQFSADSVTNDSMDFDKNTLHTTLVVFYN